MCVAPKSKLDKLSEIAYARFQELSAEEQKSNLKVISKLKFRTSKTTRVPHAPLLRARL
jgi:hypothetical protein